MQNHRIPAEFIAKLPIKNEAGAVIGEKEVVTYAGLLALAHDLGLDELSTSLIQMPTEDNGHVAVVRAIARGKAGLFTGLGDASPANVNRKVARHVLRMAETRAKARALRDLTNIGLVALEELGGDEDDAFDNRPSTNVTPINKPSPRISAPMTDAQRRLLWRKAAALGHEGRAAHAFLADRFGKSLDDVTKQEASALIDALESERGVPHAAE